MLDLQEITKIPEMTKAMGVRGANLCTGCQRMGLDIPDFEVFGEGNLRKCWPSPVLMTTSCFASVYLIFEIFRTKVVHFGSSLVRINMPLLM